MNWLARLVGGGEKTPTLDDASDAPVREDSQVRPSLGVGAVFDGLRENGDHAVLDLGRSAEASFEVYGRYARRIRFADLLRTDVAESLAAATPASLDASIPAQADHPYDVILAWDVLDRVAREGREPLMHALAERSAVGARMHIVIDPSEAPTTTRYRFTAVGVDRVRYEPAGEVVRAAPPILPAEVERLLDPFEVLRAFTSRSGLREYVAIRR